MLWPLLVLSLLPLSLAAKKSPHEQLVDLAAAGNGLIQLNEQTYDLLASPKRNWSAAVHFTALNPQRRCAPCKSVTRFQTCIGN
jgi:oligosaccharyltransferase complex subunit gamma